MKVALRASDNWIGGSGLAPDRETFLMGSRLRLSSLCGGTSLGLGASRFT